MIRHHPDPGLVFDYAAGSLAEPMAILIAAHVALCPECAAEVARVEAVGGAMLDAAATEGTEPAADDDALARALARIDAPAPEPPSAPLPDAETRRILPSPLWPYLTGGLAAQRWRWRGPAMREILLPTGADGWRVSLFRVRPGVAVPLHGHDGHEHTMVLKGGLGDRRTGQHLLRGDVETADPGRTHDQVADMGEECLCLAVLDAPVRIRGQLGWIANPFLRF
jgi:putative transcriptional regulator